MAKHTRTWWSLKFIEALEAFTDPGRLRRGRSYAGNNRILFFSIQGNTISARVLGNKSSYFGISEEPEYYVTIKFKQISQENWPKIIQNIASRAGFITKLLMNEVPDDIESAFKVTKNRLLPKNRRDIQTSCSCPDSENPCKHIAGVYYRISSELDRNPFLLFELRALSQKNLQDYLKKSRLGEALAEDLLQKEVELKESKSYYTRPELEQDEWKNTSIKEFWWGSKKLPIELPKVNKSIVKALLIKKGESSPAFWEKSDSFIEVMEEFYERVRNSLER